MWLSEDKDITLSYKGLQQFYASYFAYYNSLSATYRDVFVQRCLKFITSKTIEGADGFVPDNRVKALIAASAVQLTLGLETWTLDYFETILLYPGDFQDTPGGPMYKGDTNLRGYVRLSWKSFLRGYSISDDKLNLGLHEFSHALRFNAIKGNNQDYFVEHYFDSWLASAYEAFNDIREGQKTIFRKYGGSNINEFISVCIEHFFESPHEIKEAYPLLFYSTAALLNQLPEQEGTQIDVRAQVLERKNRVMKGFTDYPFTSPVSMAFLVSLGPLIYTIYMTGFLSGISFVLEGICILLYLHFDFKYTHLRISSRLLEIKKGLFILQHGKKQIPVSHIISFRKTAWGEKNVNYDVIYFDSADHYFYEESVICPVTHQERLVQELKENRVTYYTA
jgi:Mlc titration factor MtfA (ptsG expression regulator)